MSTAVVAYEAASLTDRMQYAQTLAKAGDLIPKGLWSPAMPGPDGKIIPPAPSPGKVLLVIETGAMLGLHPAAALQSIHVVEGRATLSAQLMAALIRKAGNRLEIKKSGTVEGGDYSVTVTGTITATGETFSATWDFPRAIRAGLVDSYQPNKDGVWEVRARSEKGHKKPWEAYSDVMPIWRAISEVARLGFSDVTYGLYSYEELTDGGPGLPVLEQEPEPTEDWLGQIAAATSAAALDEIGARLREKGEATDAIRAAWLARKGVLVRGQDGPAGPADETVDAELVGDEPAEDPAAPSEAELQEWQLLEGAEATP